jgi:hypothetical protein
MQTQRLEALLALRDRHLEHVGTPFARLGYDEIVWLTFFASPNVLPADRLALLETLASVEVAHRFASQAAFLGRDALRRYGFTTEDLVAWESQVPSPQPRLDALRAKYGWRDQRSPLRLPDVYDIAKSVGMSRAQHNYFSKAPSQSVHFSALRTMRLPAMREDGTTDPQSPSVTRAESESALGWTLNHLLNVMILTSSWHPSLGHCARRSRPPLRSPLTANHGGPRSGRGAGANRPT